MGTKISRDGISSNEANNSFCICKSTTVDELKNGYKNAVDSNIAEWIFLYGSEILKRKCFKDKSEICELYENMLKASIDLNLTKHRDFYFNKLYDKFGKANGTKINLLKGLVCESKNKHVEALNIYKTLLEKNPCDVLTRCKFINVKKNFEKNINKIIYLLNEHLKEFPTDVEAWHELGEIYLKHGSFKYALYCFEEILLHNPRNIYIVLTIAEIYCTLNNLELSSKYFCLALHIQHINIRALWGIVLINRKRYEHVKKKATQDNVDIVLTVKCINTLHKLYEESKLNSVFKEIIFSYLKKLKNHFT